MLKAVRSDKFMGRIKYLQHTEDCVEVLLCVIFELVVSHWLSHVLCVTLYTHTHTWTCGPFIIRSYKSLDNPTNINKIEMSGDDLMFQEFIDMCDEQYEDGLIEFKNGDIVNKPNENHGSAKVLSYAALADFDKETTLKLWGQYYRDVKATPDGDDHQNIRNFMKYGWDGVDFYAGIALTKKVGTDGWDWDAESFIP